MLFKLSPAHSRRSVNGHRWTDKQTEWINLLQFLRGTPGTVSPLLQDCPHFLLGPVSCALFLVTMGNGVECVSRKKMSKSQPLVPVNVTLFEKRVFADVIKGLEIILG